MNRETTPIHCNWDRRRRAGLTLVELIVASTITALIVGGMAALAMTVESGGAHGRELAITLQHAEVVLDRIERTVLDAHASNQFSGFAVFNGTDGANQFPDTLVVWSPTGDPVDPDGLPRFDEVVVFTPDPADPRRLMEITARSYAIPTPPLSDESGWQTALALLRTMHGVERVALTERLRVASAIVGDTRAGLRFASRYSPTDAELAEYPGTKNWNELPWALDMFSNQSGQRQAWCRIEMQLSTADGQEDTRGDLALPFFGSATIDFQYQK